MSTTAPRNPPETISLRTGIFDLETRQIQRVGGGQVTLTTREAALLVRLNLGNAEIVSADRLLEDVWGRRWTGEPSELGVVRNAIFKLRQKIEQNIESPEHLLTIHGEGYRFVPRMGEAPRTPPATSPIARAVRMPPPGEPWSSAWDVGYAHEERRAREALEAQHTPLVLVGPWRSGKTWLLRRLLSRLEPGDVSARVDPRGIPPDALSDFHKLAAWIALLVSEAVGLPEDESGRALAGPGPVAWRLKRWLETRALTTIDGRLLLVFEDLDRLATSACFPHLAAVLRSWCEEHRPPWSRLRVVLTSAISPTRLSSNLPSSPLNLGLVVPVRGLDIPAVEALAARMGLAPLDAEALLREVGRSPYLIRLVLRHLHERGVSEALRPTALAEALRPAFDELRHRLDAQPDLRSALGAALARPSEPLPELHRDALLRLGLLASERRPYQPTSPTLAALLAG